MDTLNSKKTTIDGLEIFPIRKIENENGKLLHVLRSDAPHFEKFGEAYMSVTNPGVIKGWKFHKTLRQNFVVPVGKVKFVFFDDRENSKTRGELAHIETGEDDYFLLKIPARLWYSFKTISDKPSYILNCATDPHDPQEAVAMDLVNDLIPYRWE